MITERPPPHSYGQVDLPFGLVIFDCDGVLVDSEALSIECLRSVLCNHGYHVDRDEVFETFLGRSFSVVEQRYLLRLGRPIGGEFVADLRRKLRASFASLQAMPGVYEILDGLRQRFCVASSSDRERLAYTLQVSGMAGRFGARVFSGDLVERGKPAPDLFCHAAQMMGEDPCRTLVIEDSVTGVQAGKAAGMTVWGFVGGSHYARHDGARLLTEAGADRIFAEMADLKRI